MDSLASAGVLFVLTHPDKPKVPIHRGWLDHPPSGTQVINHHRDGGGLGLVPYSLQSAVLDVDRGTPDKLIQHHRPYCHYKSTTPGRSHLWYRVSKPPQLYLWDYMDCGGEIICSTGHVRLPDPEQNLESLYEALTRSTSEFVFPPIPHPLPQHAQDMRGMGVGATALSPTTLLIAGYAAGQRHTGLRNELVAWIKSSPTKPNPESIREQALLYRDFLEDVSDFDSVEVERIADWAIRKVQAGDIGRTLTPENRANGGKKKGLRVRQRNFGRDKKILRLHHAGLSNRAIGKEVDISESQVRNIIKRGV